MLNIERQVVGLLRYRKIYFPDREAALKISRSLLANDVVRLFGVFDDLGTPPSMIKHEKLLTTWVDLSVGPEAVLKGMKKKSCRYEIRRAEKMLNRVRIEVNSARALRDFPRLYNSFAKAKGPISTLSARRLRECSLHSDVFVLYLEERPLCCHLLLCDPAIGIAKLLFSGSRRLEKPADAVACGALNRYLHWHEMQSYCVRGFARYDFGGIRFPEHPTARFKLSFGGSVVTEHYYLLAGTRWLARLGNFLYERLFGGSMIPSKTGIQGQGPGISERCQRADIKGRDWPSQAELPRLRK